MLYYVTPSSHLPNRPGFRGERFMRPIKRNVNVGGELQKHHLWSEGWVALTTILDIPPSVRCSLGFCEIGRNILHLPPRISCVTQPATSSVHTILKINQDIETYLGVLVPSCLSLLTFPLESVFLTMFQYYDYVLDGMHE